ncbi:MAG: crotonase/enoyl-CoA hydratase family protein [Proteobacteria bacterium]|nr:crotonase/enoyl-CoA hydratase family protein [Pseudomonadota bacterium]
MSQEKRAVRWEKDGHVATVWLCNPERRNAMGPAFWTQLPQVMGEIGLDETVRAVALCAEGPDFSVGLDLKEMAGLLSGSPDGEVARRTKFLRELTELQDSITSVEACPVPVIAALHGWCLGGGVDLSSACEIRLAARDLRLSVRETRMAMVADAGTLQRLPKIIPKGYMKELVYTGKDVGAERCKEMGLINDIYETREAVIQAVRDMAGEIAENSPLVLKGVKEVLRFGEDKSVADGLRYVGVWNSAFVFSEDLDEALAAFMEKRKPVFKGR